MTQHEWFKVYFNQLEESNPLKRVLEWYGPNLFRHLQDVFDMGVGYGMDEMVARIKGKANLSPEDEKALLERLDS